MVDPHGKKLEQIHRQRSSADAESLITPVRFCSTRSERTCLLIREDLRSESSECCCKYSRHVKVCKIQDKRHCLPLFTLQSVFCHAFLLCFSAKVILLLTMILGDSKVAPRTFENCCPSGPIQ